MTLATRATLLLSPIFILVTLLLGGCQAGDSGPAVAEVYQESTPVPQQPVPSIDTKPEVFPLGKVRGIGVADKQLLPIGKVAITLAKSGHDSDKIITSGLDNVGVGSYVYLGGRQSDANGTLIKTWTWVVTGPDGSKVPVENAATGTPRFLAGQLGQYKVKVSTVNIKGEAASSEFGVTAGRFVGSSLCISCHSGSVAEDIASKWKETAHANSFQVTYATSSGQIDYCIRCHATGYDESVDDSGFDDLARAAGWDPVKDGSLVLWLKTKNLTMTDLKNDPKLGVFLNVQCESCHGPGGTQHPDTKSYEVSVCAQCHTNEPAQWQLSKHANDPSLDVAGNSACVECHTGQGFVELRVRGKQPVFPEQASNTKPATLPSPGDMLGQTCVTCHDPHSATYPTKNGEKFESLQLRLQGSVTTPTGTKIDAGKSAVCVNCHVDKRDATYKTDYLAGKKTRSVHDSTQVNVLYGFGALDFGKAFDSSPHSKLIKDGCVTCHMAKNPIDGNGQDGNGNSGEDNTILSVGGHSFAVLGTWKLKDKPQPSQVENIVICQGCHAGADQFNRKANGDYDGNGKIEGIQTEVDGLLKLVAAKLPKDEKGEILLTDINDRNTTEIQRKALWNYWLIKNDGSRGVHNPVYAVQVLQQTYKALTGSDVPFATIR